MNQDSFIENGGVEIVSRALSSVGDLGFGSTRVGLQVLANVVLAGQQHQGSVWRHFFPDMFLRIARIRRRETCDPLCMIIYACVDGNRGLAGELCGHQGLPVLVEIVHTASSVGYGEDWLKLLLSRLFLEESHFPSLLPSLGLIVSSEKHDDIKCVDDCFVSVQSFLLHVMSDILKERIGDVIVPSDFALCVLGIFKEAVRVINVVSTSKSGVTTDCSTIDVLKYSLTIIRDMCSQDGGWGGDANMLDVVDSLISAGLLESLLRLLRELEPLPTTKRSMKQAETIETGTSYSLKLCPYKGFRRDLVAVIGNCAYHRKQVQDEVRHQNGIELLLQQCIIDRDNPFLYLKEWAIWAVRNLLEGNAENQRLVAELELQGSVDVPEISGLGLRVEIDQKTRKAKLVNVA